MNLNFAGQTRYPRIGRLPIRSVTAADVLAILHRATKRGAEVVAPNLRQWCSQVFRYAVATLRANHDLASALRGAVTRPPVNHSRPMDRDEIATGQFSVGVNTYKVCRTRIEAVDKALEQALGEAGLGGDTAER